MSPSIVVPIPRLAATLTAEVPDASSWSIVDVVNFFYDMGFMEQSEAFKEQVSCYTFAIFIFVVLVLRFLWQESKVYIMSNAGS